MTATKYPAKQHWAKVAKNLGLTEGLVYLKGDVLKERHDTDVVCPPIQDSDRPVASFVFFLLTCRLNCPSRS